MELIVGLFDEMTFRKIIHINHFPLWLKAHISEIYSELGPNEFKKALG